MAKTYNTFTNVSTGDVYTAASHNAILQNLAGYRVPPMCKVKRSTALSSYSSGTAVSWNSQVYDTEETAEEMWASSPNPERITIRTTGIYLITFSAYISFTGTMTGMSLRVLKNAALTRLQEQDWYGSRATDFIMSMSGVHSLTAGDYILCYLDYSGATANSAEFKTSEDTYFSATWLGQVS